MASSRATSTRGRTLSSGDWIAAAMDAMVEGGVGAIAIEPLAVRLGATKGSFYHHFENRDALITAMLEDWEQKQTEVVIEGLQLIEDPAERLRAVIGAAVADRPGGKRDAAILAAALHPVVKPVVQRVTARRLRYMTQTLLELGLPKARARRRARLLYLSYLGLFDYLRLGLEDEFTDGELHAYAEEFLADLIPSP